ncbi:hypothetical protein AVEN_174062-1, partial [Araneus ventricosus]
MKVLTLSSFHLQNHSFEVFIRPPRQPLVNTPQIKPPVSLEIAPQVPIHCACAC